MKLLVTILTVVAMLLGATLHARAVERYHVASPVTMADSTAWFTVSPDATDYTFEARVKLPHNFRGDATARREQWGIAWGDGEGRGCRAWLAHSIEGFDYCSADAVTLTLEAVEGSQTATLASVALPADAAKGFAKGGMTLQVNVAADGRCSIYAGDSRLLEVAELELPVQARGRITAWGVECRGKMEILLAASRVAVDPALQLVSGYTGEDIRRHLATSTDPFEGIYTYLDRDTDEELARLGGFYTIAVVASDVDATGYDIIYLDGAQTFAHRWVPGMVKGRLSATSFRDHYRLQWTDATFADTGVELTADYDRATGILSLSFPLLGSRMRFERRQRP